VDKDSLRANWPAPLKITAFTTLRGNSEVGASLAPFDYFNLGAHCGDAADAVAFNRATLRESARLPAEPVWLRQVHGVQVLHVQGAAACHPEADAAVTSQPNTVLAILTADCLPVLFCAVDGTEIAAAHAGWRGLSAGVIENTVAVMRTPPGQLLAWLGPAAGRHAYEIGEEVRAAFVDKDARAATAFVTTRPGHWHVDLFALARQRLEQIGVTRTYGGGLCTISDPQRFYSHRRDGRTGRMATLIWIGAES